MLPIQPTAITLLAYWLGKWMTGPNQSIGILISFWDLTLIHIKFSTAKSIKHQIRYQNLMLPLEEDCDFGGGEKSL